MLLNIFPTEPEQDRLGQVIGSDAQGRLHAELHHAVEPQFLQFFVINDDSRSGRIPRTYLSQVVDIRYARQASNDSNFGVYMHRRNQNPDEPLSNDDQAVIGKNIVVLRLLGVIKEQNIVEAFTLPGILSFIRRPTEEEYGILAASTLAVANE
jgi:hypothetical protein